MAVEVAGTAIQMPQGDTGVVKFVAKKGSISDDDKGIFTLARRDGTMVLRKVIAPTAGENAFYMAFVHEDTARLRAGSYEWSFRVVGGGLFDAGGRIIQTDSQHTAIIRGRLSVMRIAGGAR